MTGRLPAGTVTLLFTDIEGSTRLLDRLGDAYGDLLAEHGALLRGVWAAHRGVEVDTEGDAFFVAFARAADAVQAAAAAQRALAEHDWPADAEVRVRMGLHTGAPEVREDHYWGTDVHYAARLAAAAHGRQVLVSAATRQLIDAPLQDLGEHRLKDFPEPRRLFHLVLDGATADRFPPPRTLEVVRTNLPPAPDRLIGREGDLEALAALCKAGDSRALTLTGPGGTGKTRLALATGYTVLEHFTDGVFFVGLEGIADPAGVSAAIAGALGVAEEGIPPAVRLREFVRERRMLLILDNFEHVLDAAPEVAELAAAAPLSRVLVTSQAPLGVRGEQVVPVGPLGLPESGAGDLDALARVPSVALLLERARQADPEFALTAENAGAIGKLCTRLDGMPLALELAAARLALLHPSDLLDRVEEGLDALGHGWRDLPPRQRGLRATLDWTTCLLTDGQRDRLGRLAVFAGGFTPALAAAVADDDPLEDLAALRDVSLLRRDAHGRLSMAPPVRLYALELLRASGDEATARRRHAEAIAAFLERGERAYYLDYVATVRAATREAENVGEALRWTRDADPALHARLAAASGWLYSFASRAHELEPHVEQALDVTADPGVRARLLLSRAYIDYQVGAGSRWVEAVAAVRPLGDDETLARALFHLANVLGIQGRGQEAFAAAEELGALADRTGNELHLLLAGDMLAQSLWALGRLREALERVLAFHEQAPARSFFAMGSASAIGDVSLELGDYAAALAGFAEALRLLPGLDHPRNIVFQLDGAARALAGVDRLEDAVVTAAIADLVRSEFVVGLPDRFLADRDADLAPARAALGEDGVRRCQARAAAMGLEQGVAWVAGLA